ncbi:orcokinin peptides-like isoform X2 [Formica exsecta]|uniref:orcokinin peptides-like isoform X2 n=1 Tax=Formica exsecta TaxID=72781 RepID=UPI00114131A6|nr:orcokinin peptides-like isoform X2 [Formica exsecta]
MAVSSSIAIVFIGVAAYAVTAGPVQGVSNALQQDAYVSPDLAVVARYLENRNAGNRNLDGHLLRQTRRGLDSLSGATFGENKRYVPLRRFGAISLQPGNFDEIDRSAFDRFSKRNIDEIDTAFDSFFKRNFDEIDRAGWSVFVKRLNNYLADRQRR